MSTDREALISRLNGALTQQRYSPVLVQNYCSFANQFLRHLDESGMVLESVTPADVSDYLSLPAQAMEP